MEGVGSGLQASPATRGLGGWVGKGAHTTWCPTPGRTLCRKQTLGSLENTPYLTSQPRSRPGDRTQPSSTQSLARRHQTYRLGRAAAEQQQVRETTILRPSTLRIRHQPSIPAPAHSPADAFLPAPSPPRGPTRGLTYACLRAMSRCMGVAILRG